MTRPRLAWHLALLVLLTTAAACGDDTADDDDDDDDVVDAGPDAAPGPVGEDLGRDILDTALEVDVTAMSARATISVAAGDSDAASFEIGDLEIAAVTDGDGAPLRWEDRGDQLDVEVLGDGAATIVVEYGWSIHDQFEGVMSTGLTLTWPYYCGNVFPCHSKASPADGTTFALTLTGLADGAVAVHPAAIATAAPAYMLAWAIGDYSELDLGETADGTAIRAWYRPGGEPDAVEGTVNLRAVVEWYETTLGAYLFGDTLGSVSAPWGIGAYGGMEHHPYSHIATGAMDDQEVHAHEAAHGWFGDGIRLRCWEDFVLSEGTVTYLAARGLEAVDEAAGAAVWASYEDRLADLVGDDVVPWPTSCGEVDVLDIFTDAPYTKGAFFYRAVANRVGVEALDTVLGAFYEEHGGAAAGMQDMLDTIEAETGWDPTACAAKWLQAAGVPDDRECE
jgi:hypothetical protein